MQMPKTGEARSDRSLEMTKTAILDLQRRTPGVGPQGAPGPAGAAGATGATGATGPAGPAPSGTGFVHVTGGVLDTPAELTGDVTAGASGVATIGNDKVTYAKMQNVSATSRFLGRITAGAGDPEEMTGTQATTLLDSYAGAAKGLVPAGAGSTLKYLREDAAWASVTNFTAPPSLPQFGIGNLGNATFDGSTTIFGMVPSGNVYTLTFDQCYANVTVNTGVTINTGGYRLFCTGTLTLSGTAKIHRNGNDASGTTAGAAHANGSLAGGTGGGASAGGAGGSFSSTGMGGLHDGSSTALGGAAGANGSDGNVAFRGGGGGGGLSAGGTGGACSNQAATNGGPDINSMLQGTCFRTPATRVNSATGGGGGGSASAGAGGGGGGWVVVGARNLAGTGTIEAKGGAGGNATAGAQRGGGAGGGGGIIVCIYNTNAGVTFSVAGGSGGSGQSGGGAGGNGAAGYAVLINTSGDGT